MGSENPIAYDICTEDDIAAAARMISLAFAGTVESSEQWLRGAGLGHIRIVRERADDAPSACLLRVPMGQYFGGRSVPMLGIAGVATAPESRGRGIGRRMMQEAVREAGREGFAISTLYPSTPALYRQVGYELAGHRFITTIPVGRIDVRERAGAVRPLTDADDSAVRSCYARFAPLFDGMLDRGSYCWGRVRELRGAKFNGFGIGGFGIGEEGGKGLDGYIYINQHRESSSGFHDIATTDAVFATGAAGRRLLGFLADFATVGENATLWGGPLHPLASLMSSRHCAVEKKDYWMVRVLDLARAMEARGFAAGARGRGAIEVRDELIPGNNGTWMLSVEGGRGAAERAGSASDAVRCDIRALGPLYSGLYSARQLALLGWIEGSTSAVAALGEVFAGNGTPWMMDMF